MNDILTQVWNCLVQSSELYVCKVVNSDTSHEQAHDKQSNPNADQVDFEGY